MSPRPAARRARRLGLSVLALGALGGCALPGLTPIADRPISLDGRCEQRDVENFRERARLRLVDSSVRELSWELWVGQRGSCRFEHADFRQTQALPHVELLARDGTGCKLMVWRDQRRITLAHASCESRCTPGIYEDAWPVMFDPASGGCAANP